MKYERALAAGLFLVAAGVAPARANLVLNPGFETGDFTDWTAGSLAAVDCGSATDPAHGGNCAASFGGTSGTLLQTIVTTPGDTYTLDFWVLYNLPTGAGGIEVETTAELNASWNGNSTQVFFTASDIPYTDEIETDLTATGTSTVLEFDYFAAAPGTLLLDDVSLVDATPSAVPEPASLALFGSALLGLGWLRRRRS